MSRNTDVVAAGTGIFAIVALFAALFAAYVTHVIVTIKSASWILLAFGCIVPPIGIIHGIGSWFGAF